MSAILAVLNQEEFDLTRVLIEISAYGRPRVSMLNNGWHAAIEMTVKPVGSSFEIRSDFAHASPQEAVETLVNRMREALK